MSKTAFRALALAAGLLLPGAASAQTSAVVVADLNIRTGPSPQYQRYGTIPAGEEVDVFGCLSGYNWCDVGWTGGRGWVSGNYLAYLGNRYRRRPISEIGISVGVPVLGFDPYDYHRRYYTGRPWYRDRYLAGPDRRDRRGPGFGGGFRESRDDFAEDRGDRRGGDRDFRRGRDDFRDGGPRRDFGGDVRDGGDVRRLRRLHRGFGDGPLD